MLINKYEKILIGITGNIASGKSLAASMFNPSYFEKIDSDKIAERILITDQKVRSLLLNLLGNEIMGSDNRLNKAKLSSLAFANKGIMKRLEDIIHPLVFVKIENILKYSTRKFALIESAIIFENGFERLFDRIITVFAPFDIRINRLIERSKIDYSEAKRRIMFQMDEYIKILLSDFVIDNSGQREYLKRQVKNIEYKIQNIYR
ncbi:MAG: dephospho-CoA kinase [Myxococcota bacterium]